MSKGKPSKYDGLVKIGPAGDPCWTGEGLFDEEALALPLRWKAPRRIFVDSMSDLFFDAFTNEQIAAVFGVMAACPQHTFQVLTKRSRRMREWFEWLRSSSEDSFTMQQRGIAAAPNTARALLDAAYEYLGEKWKPELDTAWRRLEDDPWPLPNVWLGVSVEHQDAADERIPELLRMPAAVRFLSCEPLLGPLDIAPYLYGGRHPTCPRCLFSTNRLSTTSCPNDSTPLGPDIAIDWAIAGCESGPGARPCDVAWLRSLRDQCAEADVPFFLKQAVETYLGRCGDSDNPNGDQPCGKRVTAHVISPDTAAYSCGCTVDGSEDGACVPLGFGDGSRRKSGGVIELPYLYGVQHAAFPETSK